MPAPLSFEPTGRFHRVPVGFGPAPTPRQDKDGNRFDWSDSQATTTGQFKLKFRALYVLHKTDHVCLFKV